MKKNKWGKKKHKMRSLRRKRVPRNLLLEPWLVLKEMKQMMGIKGVGPSGLDSTQLTLQFVNRKTPGKVKASTNVTQGGSQVPLQAGSRSW